MNIQINKKINNIQDLFNNKFNLEEKLIFSFLVTEHIYNKKLQNKPIEAFEINFYTKQWEGIPQNSEWMKKASNPPTQREHLIENLEDLGKIPEEDLYEFFTAFHDTMVFIEKGELKVLDGIDRLPNIPVLKNFKNKLKEMAEKAPLSKMNKFSVVCDGKSTLNNTLTENDYKTTFNPFTCDLKGRPKNRYKI